MDRKQETSERFAECVWKLVAIITEYREKNRETKAAFAKGCGISTSLIRRIETGIANSRINSLNKIAGHMGMSVGELLYCMGILNLDAGEDGGPEPIQISSADIDCAGAQE